MTEKEKIKHFLDLKSITKNQFYATTGLSIGFLDKGNTIGVDKLKIIIYKYADFNIDWFLFDRGSPVKEPGKAITEVVRHCKNCNTLNKVIDNQKELISSLKETIDSQKVTITTQSKHIYTLENLLDNSANQKRPPQV